MAVGHRPESFLSRSVDIACCRYLRYHCSAVCAHRLGQTSARMVPCELIPDCRSRGVRGDAYDCAPWVYTSLRTLNCLISEKKTQPIENCMRVLIVNTLHLKVSIAPKEVSLRIAADQQSFPVCINSVNRQLLIFDLPHTYCGKKSLLAFQSGGSFNFFGQRLVA